jgi:hypothetical protein
MAQQNILALAKQGNPKAIAALINRSLNSQGITAKVERREECLHILLESEQLPNRKALVAFIRKGIMGLGVPSINIVKIYGRQLGTDSPTWKQKIELRINFAATSAPQLSEQKASRSPLPSLKNSLFEQRKKSVIAKPITSVQRAGFIKNTFLNIKTPTFFAWGFFLRFLLVSMEIDINDPLIILIGYIIFPILPVVLAVRCLEALQINPRHIIGNVPSNYHWLPMVSLVIAMLLFSIGILYSVWNFLYFVVPSFAEPTLQPIFLPSASKTSVSFIYQLPNIIPLVIVAPITEEFFFRGVLLHRLAAKWGIRPAIIITSLVFGFLHLNFLGLSLFGLVMALLYIKTGTLIVPIICHTLNNGLAFSLRFLPIAFNLDKNVYSLEQFRVGLVDRSSFNSLVSSLVDSFYLQKLA